MMYSQGLRTMSILVLTMHTFVGSQTRDEELMPTYVTSHPYPEGVTFSDVQSGGVTSPGDQFKEPLTVLPQSEWASSTDIPNSNDTEDDTGNASEVISAEKRLLGVLTDRYNRVGHMGRPVRNSSYPITVKFGLGLLQMELDERSKIFSMNMWSRYQWIDEYLTWDPEDFEGVTNVRLESQSIWIPDIMLYNTADVDVEIRNALAIVTSSGLVTWFPHSIFRSSCSIDVTNYPFDSQQCHVWFGSWTYSSREIDLQMLMSKGIDLSTFQSDNKESSGWDVMNITGRRALMPSPEDEPNYAVLMFAIHLRRRMVFATYILTLPCVFLAALTLVVFWLPPERPDRTALAMSSFSSYMVLLLILVEAAMPTSTSVPLLGVYYCYNMVIIMLSIILSSLVVNLSRGGEKRPPRWLVNLTIRGIGKMLCMTDIEVPFIDFAVDSDHGNLDHDLKPRRRKMSIVKSEKQYTASDRTSGDANGISDVAAETTILIQRQECHHPQKQPSVTIGGHHYKNTGNGGCTLEDLHTQMTEIRNTLQHLEQSAQEKTATARMTMLRNREWRNVGRVLDRFFFVIYMFLNAISLTILFPKPGKYYPSKN